LQGNNRNTEAWPGCLLPLSAATRLKPLAMANTKRFSPIKELDLKVFMA